MRRMKTLAIVLANLEREKQMKMKIELPATIPGRVMRGLVDVLQRQELNVTVQAQGIRGRKSATSAMYKLVLLCEKGGEAEGNA